MKLIKEEENIYNLTDVSPKVRFMFLFLGHRLGECIFKVKEECFMTLNFNVFLFLDWSGFNELVVTRETC